MDCVNVRKFCFIVVCAGIVFSTYVLCAWGEKDEEIPEGMEVRVFGQTKLIVPKDARVQERNGLIIVEGIDTYVARSLSEMQQNIAALKAQQQELQQEVQQLKEVLAEQAAQ